MAAARDQAARILRPEPKKPEGEIARDASAVLADQLRAQLAEETVARRPVEAPERPVIDKPVATEAVANPGASKPGKRKLVFTFIGALLALAASAYGVHYFL